jgi:hypothetical protein
VIINPQESYPAGRIEPGWQIFIDDQWLVVGIVIESETPDGTRYITVVFEDSKRPSAKYRKTEVIVARPPDLPPAVEPES